MGAIWFNRFELLATLSEHAGHKAGIAITERQLRRHLGEHRTFLFGLRNAMVRIRSEEFEGMAAALLYALGNTPTPEPVIIPGSRPIRRMSTTEKGRVIVERTIGLLKAILDSQAAIARPPRWPRTRR